MYIHVLFCVTILKSMLLGWTLGFDNQLVCSFPEKTIPPTVSITYMLAVLCVRLEP